MQKILITLLFTTLFLGGCAHKIDIQQGNVVTQSQLEQLQPGMTKAQVRTLLGNPLLVDPFHPERWDYYYSVSRGKELQQRYRLTLFFSGDTLSHIEKEGEFPAEEYQKPQED